MLKNNLISSLRFLRRNLGFTFINIFGLTIGLTSFLIILFYVNHELSFDSFHQNRDNVYRINFSFQDNSGNESVLVNSPPAFAPGIQGQFPELKKIARMRYTQNCLFANEERRFYEDHGYYADSLFLEILRFELASGDPTTALDEPNSIVLTRELALKYFDSPDPLGATLVFNNGIPLKVTGIISSVPSNSHLNFDFLVSFSTYVVPDGYASDLTSWSWLGFLTYAELENAADHRQFQDKLYQLMEERSPEGVRPMQPRVQNLSEIYLGSAGMTDDLSSHIRSGSELSVYSMMAAAVLILIIAGFNFSNLTNAISLNRSKAIGIRKVLGARQPALIGQLLSETMLLTLICLFLAYGISILIFPVLGTYLEWEIVVGFRQILTTLPVMILVILLLGLVAGSYPAILLSGFNVIGSLKGELRKGRKKSPLQLKNVLVLLQFSISIALISATFVLVQQINYLKNRSTGFDKENVVVVKVLPEDMSRFYKAYKDQLDQQSTILGVSRSERVVGDPWPFSGIRRTDEDQEQIKRIFFNLADFDYFKTMGIDVLEGRSFSEEFARDSLGSIVINQKAAAFLGIEDSAVGTQVHFFELDGPRTVIGVVEDFNYTSLHQEIGPAVVILPFIDLEYMYIRMAPGDPSERISLIENTWKEVSAGTPIEWRFLDDRLDQLYKSEEKLSFLITVFSILAVSLACLGLYGIVAFMINNRTKEFGVRKVLGATILSLYVLFVRQYVIQIVIATVIVIPVLHYYLNTWLQEFAYRIEIGYWIYPLTTLLLMIIALLTVTVQTVRAAKENPVNALRQE